MIAATLHRLRSIACAFGLAFLLSLVSAVAQTSSPFPKIWDTKFDKPPEPGWEKNASFRLPIELDQTRKYEFPIGVTIDACIGPTGDVVRAGLILKDEIREFDSKQLEVMRTWNFAPALVGGKPAGLCGLAYVLVFQPKAGAAAGLEKGVSIQIWTDGSKHPPPRVG